MFRGGNKSPVRVIAGRFKGRRLKTPTWAGIRPTSDKLRETLFNILAPRIAGARVLDGFAGTGAVGIEALSRGAPHVTFVERDRRAAALIAENLALCGVEEGYTIECGDVASVLRRARADAAFDLILLDPPYDADPDTVTRTLAAAADRMAAGALLVLERPRRREPVVPPPLARLRDVVSGDSTLTFLTR
ncbi:MAG: 16S rRNA (guanine(966)-N(2))-methyltransferase RsmD [Acidobacteria bacterium]|nr:16S rRNA (guanine(966)-N(2))-methyltransferase RsmD [Acidobacteriota bacterium]